MKKLQLLIVMLLSVIGMNAQNTDWDSQTKITGYVSAEFNNFSQLQGYKMNFGAALSEAGLLATYMPTSRLTFKSVFVYRPDFSFNQMLNEANFQFRVSDFFVVKAGRFLTPLSPMNTYYYAPVNSSATLPMLITNHEFFPLNMDAISFNGSVGENLKISYDLFAGGYRNTTWLKTGALGFFGDEVAYYKKVTESNNTVDPSYNNTKNFGGGFHISVSYQDYITVGASGFKPKNEIMPIYIIPMDLTRDMASKKFSYGVNFKLKYKGTSLAGEYWQSDLNIDNSNIDLEGSFVELSQVAGKFIPYVRYEKQKTDDIDYKRYTAGMAFKPMFETTIKVEYLRYEQEVANINGVVASVIYSF